MSPSSSFDEQLSAHVASSEVILSRPSQHPPWSRWHQRISQLLFLRRLSPARRVPCTHRTREFLACGCHQSMSCRALPDCHRRCLAHGAFAVVDLQLVLRSTTWSTVFACREGQYPSVAFRQRFSSRRVAGSSPCHWCSPRT